MAVKRRVSRVKLLTNPFIAGQAGIRKHPDIEAKKFREFLMYVPKDDGETKVKDREILYINMQNLISTLSKTMSIISITGIAIVLEAYKYEYFTLNYMYKSIIKVGITKCASEKSLRRMIKNGVIDVYFDKNKDVEIEYKQIFEDGWKDQKRKYCISGETRRIIDAYVMA